VIYKICWLLFVFLSIQIISRAQVIHQTQVTDRLILEKLGRKNRIVYQLGDAIILKLKNDPNEFNGIITEFYDSVMVVEDIYVHLEDIQYVKTRHTNGFLSPSNGPKLIVAGVTLFLIDQLNHTVIQGNDFRIPKEIAIASATLVAVGIFWTTLKYRKFKPGKNKRIRIVLLE
jgi:hypothetical protein